MAVKDVREYYFKALAQYVEMKEDLADFEQALKDGHITEDQLQAAKDDVAIVQQNVDRLSYIMFLLEAPARKSKQARYEGQHKRVLGALKEKKADAESVLAENESAIGLLYAEFEKLKREENE